MLRHKIYEAIEVSREGDRLSTAYDVVMMGSIVVSLVPLAFKESNPVFDIIEKAVAVLFILDYFLRESTADLKLGRGALSFLIYPFTFMALVDLVSILPSLIPIWSGLRMLRLLRIVRTFRVFRAFKMLRYSKSIRIITNVIRSQKTPLLAVGTLALAYVLISALVIFNVEPDTFGSFFDAVYWATISLTTVGYGDISPVTPAGKAVTMLSAFVGIAIVALPSGIITAGYMDELNKQNKED